MDNKAYSFTNGGTETDKSKPYLSPRQRQVYELLFTPLTRTEIAEVLGIKEQTACNYMDMIYQKYDVQSRCMLIGNESFVMPSGLTPRQQILFERLMSRSSLQQIALDLNIRYQSLRNQLTGLYRATNVTGRSMLIARYANKQKYG